ncbi:MAG: DUF4189 domain-containing protein [Sphingomonadales bacterium]
MDWGHAVVLSAGFLLAPLPAVADCVSDCRASTYCDDTAGWDCSSRLNDCYRRECSGPAASFGAIAYGKVSQAYGYSFGFADSRGAQKKAMATCRINGDDCAIVATFSNGCAAVAAASGPGYAVAQGGTEQAAQAQALKRCRADGITGCEIQVWSCAEP